MTPVSGVEAPGNTVAFPSTTRQASSKLKLAAMTLTTVPRPPRMGFKNGLGIGGAAVLEISNTMSALLASAGSSE